MHRIFGYSAFGWIAFSGAMHFIVDVVAHHLRGKSLPEAELMLYYGLHTAYATGQVLFGLLGVFVMRHAPVVFDRWSARAFCIAAFLAWGATWFVFIDYWEPGLNIAVFGVFLALALSLRR